MNLISIMITILASHDQICVIERYLKCVILFIECSVKGIFIIFCKANLALLRVIEKTLSLTASDAEFTPQVRERRECNVGVSIHTI